MSPYDDWVAAGKPRAGAPVTGTKKFQDLMAKSTKKSKTTGVSPQQKAIQDLIESTYTKGDKNANKAFAEDVKRENQAADEQRKIDEKQQKVENEVKAEGFKKSFELRAGIGAGDLSKVQGPDNPDMTDVQKLGAQVQKEQEKLNKLSTPPKKENQPPPPSTTPVDTSNMSAADALIALQHQAAQAQANPTSAKQITDAIDRGNNEGFLDLLGRVGTGALNTLSRGIDVVSRPGYAVSAGIEAYSNPDQSMSDVLSAMAKGLTGEKKTTWSDVIDANRSGVITDPQDPTGQRKIQFDPKTQQWVDAKEINPILKAGVGLAGDVLADPTTYVGIGTAAKAAKGIMAGSAARAEIDVAAQAAKEGLKKATLSTASKKVISEANKIATKAKADYIKAGGVIGANPTEDMKLFDEVMQATGDLAGAQAAVQQKALARVGVQAEQTAAERLAKENERVLTLKIGGTPVGTKFTGAVSSGVRKGVEAAASTRVGKKVASAEEGVSHLLNKAFNTRYYFPGKTHELSKLAHEKGILNYKDAVKEIQDTFHGLTRAERVRVADSIEHGISLAGEKAKNGKDLGDLQDFFKAKRDAMFNEDMNILGKYIPADHSDNFVFHFYRAGGESGPAGKIAAWKRARKAALRANDQQAIARSSLAEAEKAGLKPIREADKVLIAHYGDHGRRLVRDDFVRKVVDNYGMVSDNGIGAHMMGLVEMKPPKGMKLAKGHKLYVTPEVKQVLERTARMMSTSDDMIRGALRGYDQAIRHWKFLNTAVNPAHHVRNSISDFFMNYMDGVVNPYRYKQAIDMLHSGRRAGLRFKIGGRTITGDEMWKMYRRSGSSQGFMASELNEGVTALHRGIYKFAEHREEWTRLAHFLDIMQKETKHLTPGNTVGVWKKVREAGKRVNKWNIDYADLTPFERNVMKRVVPFYTFYRKALPLMIESMATKPGRLIIAPKGSRAIENLLGINPLDQDQTAYPEWLTQLGFARLSNGPTDPMVWSPGIPTQLPGDFLQGGDVQGILRNALGMTTPPIKYGIEKATGRSLTTGGPTSAGLDQFASTQAQDTLSAALNLSGASNLPGLDSLSSLLGGDKTYKNDKIWQFNKLAGLGVYKIGDTQQATELRRREQVIKSQLSRYNQQLGDYEIHQIKNGYRVYDPRTKDGVKDFTGPDAQIDAYRYGILLAKSEKK